MHLHNLPLLECNIGIEVAVLQDFALCLLCKWFLVTEGEKG